MLEKRGLHECLSLYGVHLSISHTCYGHALIISSARGLT